MVPKANRLRRRQDFKQVYENGRRRSTINLTVRALRQRKAVNKAENKADDAQLKSAEAPDRNPPTRIGISISQKVSKRAVIRNRIKRQIRAALRQMLHRIKAGWLVVLVVRPEAIACDYAQLLRELEQLLVEAEVLNGS